jgi:hypothetical protein
MERMKMAGVELKPSEAIEAIRRVDADEAWWRSVVEAKRREWSYRVLERDAAGRLTLDDLDLAQHPNPELRELYRRARYVAVVQGPDTRIVQPFKPGGGPFASREEAEAWAREKAEELALDRAFWEWESRAEDVAVELAAKREGR